MVARINIRARILPRSLVPLVWFPPLLFHHSMCAGSSGNVSGANGTATLVLVPCDSAPLWDMVVDAS